MDDLPVIDVSLPEPDFFDAEDNGNDSGELRSFVIAEDDVSPPMEQEEPPSAGLKLDDDMCEFNEFLMFDNDDESKLNDVKDATNSVLEEDGPTCNEEEEVDAPANGQSVNGFVNGSLMSSNSEPSTPESRHGSSAVVHIVALQMIPKVSLDSGKKIVIKSPDKPTVITTPPRMTRGRLNVPVRESSRSKRKLSDDEEQDGHKATRSGRQPRKITRYGFEGDSSEEEREESLFEPIKPTKKSKYWSGKNGFMFYRDKNGHTTELRPIILCLERCSSVPTQTVYDSDPAPSESTNSFLLEVCIDNFRSAGEAVRGGAKRIELCSSLSEGGLTPSVGFLQMVKEHYSSVPVFVMIRPRGGDFFYSTEEIKIMTNDIAYYKKMGADGFVFGVLTQDCKVDEESCKTLLEEAYPLPCTFHRAFDKVEHPYSSLETIIKLGFSRILTSGQDVTAQAGISAINRLIGAAKGRIIILPGCGINEKNIGEIVKKTRVKEVHGSASKPVASSMCIAGSSKSNKRIPSKSKVKMGSSDDNVIKITDANVVSKMLKSARRVVSRY